MGSSFLGIAVGVVASQAIEGPAALRKASTPREIRGGKTCRQGIIAHNVFSERTVALTAHSNDLVPSTITVAGPCNCHVGKLERDRLQVIRSWSVTTFAPNSTIGRLGTRLISC